MPVRVLSRLGFALRVGISLAPWVCVMYLFYWLDSSGTWTRETPHRGKLSILMLSAGMVLSLLAWSSLTRRVRK